MPADMTLGERVRYARERRGMTQVVLAGLAGTSERHLRRIESDGFIPEMALSLRLAEALGIKDLRELTGQPFVVAADGQRGHPAVASISAALSARAVFSPRLLRDDVELPDLARLARRVSEAWTVAQDPGSFRYAHAGALLPGLIGDAELAYRVHRSMSTAAQARELLVMVHLLARPLLKWVGHQDLALIPAERAMAVAEDGDDPAVLGAAAWNLAQALSTMRQPEASRVVAEDAVAAVDDAAGREDAPAPLLAVQGALHLIAAVGASRDEDQTLARRHLTAADVLAARLGHDTNHFRLAFGPTNVQIHRVSLATEWGHADLALAGALGVMADRSPSVERRVAHRLDVAQARARQREDEAAVAALLDAERLSPEQLLYSVTARLTVGELLRRRRERKARLTGLYPLAERLRLVA